MRIAKTQGFTLTELVIVIVIMGILATVVSPLIANKFTTVHQSTQRAHWVQQAEYALFQLRQDLANSVPNSIFVDASTEQVEFLGAPPTAQLFVARYRDEPNLGRDLLQPNSDDKFDIFGDFTVQPTYVSIGTLNPVDMRTDWQKLQTNGTSGTLAKIQQMSKVAASAPTETRITLAAVHNFGFGSPGSRAYFSNGPIAYDCNATDNLLYRITEYDSLKLGDPFVLRTNPAVIANNRARVIDSLIFCRFELLAGGTFSPPALRISLTIGDSNGRIELIDTILLSNGS